MRSKLFNRRQTLKNNKEKFLIIKNFKKTKNSNQNSEDQI